MTDDFNLPPRDEREGNEPDFDPPRIDCCESAKATGGAYHAPGCEHYTDATARELRRTGIKRKGRRRGPIA